MVISVASVTAAAGLVGIAGTGSAAAEPAPVSLTLEYRCDYPLIGMKEIVAEATAVLPDEVTMGPGGGTLKGFTISAETTIGADTTEGLYTMNAATIEGFATASATVSRPGSSSIGAKAFLRIAGTRVPESGPFQVDASAFRATPDIVSPNEGWATINVGNLVLSVTPKDKDGNPTALGTLNVTCYQKPGQNNVLHQFYYKGESPKPPRPEPRSIPTDQPVEPGTRAYPRHRHSVTLDYTCKYPLIGPHPVQVRARLEYPDAVPAGYVTPRLAITSVNLTDTDTTEGLLTLDPPAATVEGEAVARARLTAPDVAAGPLTVRVKLPIPKTSIPPAPARPLEIPAEGSAPALVFEKPGKATIDVGDIDLTMTPRTATGDLTPFGVIRTTCAQHPGQDGELADIDVLPEPDTAAPSAPGAPSATGKSDTSVRLQWGVATDDVGIAGYDVYDGTAKVAETYGTGTGATVTGLQPDTDHTFTVKARDGSGNISAASSPVSVRTDAGKDTRPPTVPAAPTVTGRTERSLSITWPASSDNVAVTGYEVFKNGSPALRVPGTAATLTGLNPGTRYDIRVRARDGAGNPSALSPTLSASTKPDTKPPTTPGKPRVTGRTARTVSLAWRASADDIGVTGYDLFRNGKPVLRVTGTSAVATDLRPDTAYKFRVRARDRAGNLSPLSETVTVRTKAPATANRDAIAGAADDPFELFLDIVAADGQDDTGPALVPER